VATAGTVLADVMLTGGAKIAAIFIHGVAAVVTRPAIPFIQPDKRRVWAVSIQNSSNQMKEVADSAAG
jgi:hypothetical protein